MVASVRLPTIPGLTGLDRQAAFDTGLRVQPFRPGNLSGIGTWTGSYRDLLPASLQDNPFAGNAQLGGAMDKLGQMFGGGSTIGSLAGFGQFDPGDEQLVNAAANAAGVPAAFLASIIKAESSGDWAGNNAKGAMYLPERGEPLLPYIGVFQSTAQSRLGQSIGSVVGNKAAQIDMLAKVLRSQYDELKRMNPGYDWNNVASYHYSGKPDPYKQLWFDEKGNGSNLDYMNKIMGWVGQLGGLGSAGQPLGGGGSSGFDSIWGGKGDFPITQEMGLTDFAQQHLGGMYAYSTAYGVQGHAGLDVGMNPGTRLYVPTGGTVVYNGGTGYYRDERYGNAPGTGELRIRLDNGDELILGHMESIALQPGQRVNAGSFAGLSGTANGGHVHVEYRKLGGNTSSGYTAVDPRQALGALSPSLVGQQLNPLASFGQSNPMAGLSFGASLARFLYDPSFRQSLEGLKALAR